MAHELETYDNGETGFIANRVPGWHGLGTVYTGAERLDLQLAMNTARLSGWDVRLAPVYAIDSDGDPITTEEWAMTVRNNPTDPFAPPQPLGMVSPAYTVVQNEEAFAFGQNLLDEGLEVEAAGSLRGGKQTFILYRLPRALGANTDVIYPYLHVATSHDGSLAVTAKPTLVRVVCANTQAASFLDGAPMYKAVHVGEGIDGKVADAREALGIALGTFDTFEAEMDLWLNTPTSSLMVDKVLAAQYPEKKGESQQATKARLQALTDVRFLYEVAPTNSAITGTAWGLAQALIEWGDWMKGRAEGEARARWQVSNDADLWRRSALATVKEVVMN